MKPARLALDGDKILAVPIEPEQDGEAIKIVGVRHYVRAVEPVRKLCVGEDTAVSHKLMGVHSTEQRHALAEIIIFDDDVIVRLECGAHAASLRAAARSSNHADTSASNQPTARPPSKTAFGNLLCI